jgi:DNA-binding NtrC family response regulator
LRRKISVDKGPIGTEKAGVRILLVDDEKSIQDILSVALQPAGYSLYPVPRVRRLFRDLSWPGPS